MQGMQAMVRVADDHFMASSLFSQVPALYSQILSHGDLRYWVRIYSRMGTYAGGQVALALHQRLPAPFPVLLASRYSTVLI